MSARVGRRLEITFWPNRSKSRGTRSLRVGLSRLQTLSTRWFRGSLRTASAWMAPMRSRITPGWKISHGKICGTGRFKHLLCHQKRTTLIKRTSMRTGRTKKMKSSSRTCWAWGETPFKLSSTGTILTFSWQLSVRIQHSSTLLEGLK